MATTAFVWAPFYRTDFLFYIPFVVWYADTLTATAPRVIEGQAPFSHTYIVVLTTFVSSLPASQRLSHQRYYIQRHNDGASLRLARFFHTGEIPFIKGFEQL